MDNIKVIYDISEGTKIEESLTPEEIKQKELDKAAFEKEQDEFRKIELARRAILDRLGLTEEEVRLLLG